MDKDSELDLDAELIIKGVELMSFYIEKLVKEYPTKKQVVEELLRLIKSFLESSFALLDFYVNEKEVSKYVK